MTPIAPSRRASRESWFRITAHEIWILFPATIEALPLVAEKVAGRVPVIVDGGVRRGTDVLKALANGANAAMIGRPYLYGLSVAGDAGVARVVDILRREFEMAMALTGRPTIASIDRTVLWT